MNILPENTTPENYDLVFNALKKKNPYLVTREICEIIYKATMDKDIIGCAMKKHMFPKECFINIKTGEPTKKCLSCRQIDINASNSRNIVIKTLAQKSHNTNFPLCTNCKQNRPKADFIGKNNMYCVECKYCRANNAINEPKRKDKDFRNKKKRIRVRDRIKGVIYEEKHKANEILKYGIEYIKKKEAEYSAKWRKAHQDEQIEFNTARRLDPHCRYAYYRYRATDSNIEFTMSEEEMISLFTSQCKYCGEKYEGQGKNLLGVDRINNSKGYIKENCVSCCEMCNIMKNDYTEADFLGHSYLIGIMFIKKINPMLEKYLYPNIKSTYIPKDTISGNFKSYVRSAIKREKEFLLEFHIFNSIIVERCYLCNKPNTTKHHNGIDRIDSSKDYIKDNCKSCCTMCNYMKNSYKIDSFLKQIIKIIKHRIYYSLYKITAVDAPEYNIQNTALSDDIFTANKMMFDLLIQPYNILKSAEQKCHIKYNNIKYDKFITEAQRLEFKHIDKKELDEQEMFEDMQNFIGVTHSNKNHVNIKYTDIKESHGQPSSRYDKNEKIINRQKRKQIKTENRLKKLGIL